MCNNPYTWTWPTCTFLSSLILSIFKYKDIFYVVLLNNHLVTCQPQTNKRTTPGKSAHQLIIIAISYANSTDFPDSISLSLSPSIPVIHRSQQVSQALPTLLTELMEINSYWLANTGVFI